MTTEKDIHTEHCCAIHGCKYQKTDCSVVLKQKLQSFECEQCEDSKAELEELLQIYGVPHKYKN